MNVQTRGLLLLVTLLVGCGMQKNYTLVWPGVCASGFTLFGGDPKYNRITCTGPPAFSVRLPGGRIIKPGEFTIAKLESHGAKKKQDRKNWYIKSGAGTLFANFDKQNRLLNISLTAHTGEGTVFVGDRNGRRMIPLPATREELVKLFGEPERESARTLH